MGSVLSANDLSVSFFYVLYDCCNARILREGEEGVGKNENYSSHRKKRIFAIPARPENVWGCTHRAYHTASLPWIRGNAGRESG
jgi:hypothetical protein